MFVGIDSLDINRIKKLLGKNINKVFTKSEQEYALNSVTKYERFAGIFCAKEAFLKALKIGLYGGVALTDVQISHNDLGAPYLVLSDNVVKVLNEKGIKSHDISITHANKIATAICILY